MHRDIDRILFSEGSIRERVVELGRQITRETAGEDVVMLALLKGGVVFLADLIRAIERPLQLDFAWVSSYGAGTESSGQVELKVFPEDDLAGKVVIVVDDILDTGRTLRKVSERLLRDGGAREVKTCVLLDKKARRAVELEADYVGFEVDDLFVVGYGLDYGDRYRNLPYIGVLKEHLYRSSVAESSG